MPSNPLPTAVRIITAAALAALAGAAQAGPVYDYVGAEFTLVYGAQQGIFSEGDRLSGWVEFDATPVAGGSLGAGNVVAFALTDGHWTLSSANGKFHDPANIQFQFDDDLNISQWLFVLIPIAATNIDDMLWTQRSGAGSVDASRMGNGATFGAHAYEAGGWSLRGAGTVPEPGALALAGLALAAAGFARWRRPVGVYRGWQIDHGVERQ